jgi:hypothetical protein
MPQMLVNGEIVEIDHEEHAEVTSNLDEVKPLQPSRPRLPSWSSRS